MSMLGGGHFCRALQRGEDLAGNVAFEAADDFDLAHSLPDAAEHVPLGSGFKIKPDQNDAMESGISLAVDPRACGGTRRGCQRRCDYTGLSPRVRGNLWMTPLVEQGEGSIPARAGEPSLQPLELPAYAVYPRACGGTC